MFEVVDIQTLIDANAPQELIMDFMKQFVFVQPLKQFCLAKKLIEIVNKFDSSLHKTAIIFHVLKYLPTSPHRDEIITSFNWQFADIKEEEGDEESDGIQITNWADLAPLVCRGLERFPTLCKSHEDPEEETFEFLSSLTCAKMQL